MRRSGDNGRRDAANRSRGRRAAVCRGVPRAGGAGGGGLRRRRSAGGRGRGRVRLDPDSVRQGGFILSDVPVGVYELSVRHLGYAPLRHMVNVARGATTDTQIGLVPAPLEMEPLVATAVRLRRLEIKGFYERKRWGALLGLGAFLTVSDIERRNPWLISAGPGSRCGVVAIWTK